MISGKTLLSLAFSAIAASGCITVTPPTSLHQPLSARPVAPQPSAPLDGSIYSAGYSRGMFFEDRRARSVGDTLTIVISEKTDASKKSNTNTGRTSNNSFSVTALKHLPGKALLGSDLAATSDFSFDGKG